jgi:hypothetical protein
MALSRSLLYVELRKGSEENQRPIFVHVENEGIVFFVGEVPASCKRLQDTGMIGSSATKISHQSRLADFLTIIPPQLSTPSL